MPDWVAAVDQRLRWLARRRRGRAAMLRRLTRAMAALPHDDPALLERFQHACLQRLEAAMAANPVLMAAREELAHRVALARAALAGDEEARRALERREDEMFLGGDAFGAGRVPGRAVWLAMMAKAVPEEIMPASVALVNDLQTLGRDATLRALEAMAR
ncbi:hypothetical protein GXW78_12215 [Roseomonas terrae]|uniref:Uncharacterized protein n=1 Tax=Neoroseomonas terrae TaxID=424799 RepID=A0ABS5EHF0_9PROT|nr:hypothetical protein [Neoroseomonas terrae]MBR0650431.1 hypothetical protein [Neoroseomonas terrae]